MYIVNFILNTNIKKQRHNNNQINHEKITITARLYHISLMD